MFDNIGKKVKTLAKVICWIGIIGSIIGGIVCFAIDEDLIGIGFAIMFGGALFSWLGSFFTYGFGELIDKATQIERNTRKDNRPSDVQAKVESKRIDELEKLRAEGLISEEEYQNAVAKGNQ